MRLINRKTIDQLPTGFDDEMSPFFVPEHLRDAYLTQPSTGRKLLTAESAGDAATRLAERDTLNDLGPYPDIDPFATDRRRTAELADAQQEWKAARRSRRADLLENPTAELEQLVTHATRLAAAERQHTHTARRDALERERRALHTCPVCGVDDINRTGAVERRLLLPGDQSAQDRMRLRSCGLCFLVAQQQLLDAARSEVLPDGRNREQAVATAPRGTGEDPFRLPSGGGWDTVHTSAAQELTF